jgi:hypothetical protein
MDNDNSQRESPDEKQKRQNEFWKKLVWELTSCDEATEVFPEMLECPVCGNKAEKIEMSDEFILVHKDLEELVN